MRETLDAYASITSPASAPARLPLCRSAPEKQLRQGPEDRIAPSPYRQSRRGAADPMISRAVRRIVAATTSRHCALRISEVRTSSEEPFSEIVKAMVARILPNAGRVDVLVGNAEGKLGGKYHREKWCKRRTIACRKVAFHRAPLRRDGTVRRLDSQCFFSFASTCTFCASCVGEKASASTCCGSGKTPATASGGGGKTSTTTPTRTSNASRSSSCE